jgi:hypothetical protein
VQREIARQRRDFEFLLTKPGKDSIDAIRNYAFAEVSLTDKEQALLE